MEKTHTTGPELLRDWLKSGGRKVNWLADQVPVDRATASQWLNGHWKPQPGRRERIETITGGAVPAGAWVDGDTQQGEGLEK